MATVTGALEFRLFVLINSPRLRFDVQNLTTLNVAYGLFATLMRQFDHESEVRRICSVYKLLLWVFVNIACLQSIYDWQPIDGELRARLTNFARVLNTSLEQVPPIDV